MEHAVAVRSVLPLGDPGLYLSSSPVTAGEVAALAGVVDDLRDTLFDFRAHFFAGRAIAAPQIGVAKRLIMLMFPSRACSSIQC